MEKKLEEVINRLEAVKEEIARLEAVIAELKAAESVSETFSAEGPADISEPIDLTLNETDLIAVAAPAVAALSEAGTDAMDAFEAEIVDADDTETGDIPVPEDLPEDPEPAATEISEPDIPEPREQTSGPEETPASGNPGEKSPAEDDAPASENPGEKLSGQEEKILNPEKSGEPEIPAARVMDPETPEDGGFFDLFGEEYAPVQKEPKGRRRRESIAEAAESTRTVADAMTQDAAWRTDIPGPEVKSLRSAIALGDQVLFIARLFRKDSALYQDTVDRLNSTATLADAISYLSGTFPEWDLASDDVYKFMMAVRRKIRR